MGKQSNHFVEALTALWGIRKARNLKVNNLIMEGDYHNIINNLSGTQKLNRTIIDFINEANKICNDINFIIQHVYKEGNSDIDTLDNV
ncbi:hypothetical protein KI387_009015, partial [Taxus chinensis]